MLRLYRIPFSTNVERVAHALGPKGLEADWVDVEPGDTRETSGGVPCVLRSSLISGTSTSRARLDP